MADLAKLLESEASAEIETILAEARSKADGIVKAAQAQASSILEGKRRALENELEAARVRAKSAVDLEGAALRLKASHTASQQAFSSAESELRQFTKSGEYLGVLQKLIGEASEALGSISKLEVNPNDLEMAQKALSALGLNAEVSANAAIETGIRALNESGNSSITNTLLGRLIRAKDGLLADVAKVLG
ncbi:MAG: V-type ATP synthase subunit E [Deinococcales bacterium]